MYRQLDGVTGRFLNRDPIRERGGINLYDYTRSNPINRIDPLGLCPNPNKCEEIAKLGGAVADIGAGTALVGLGVAFIPFGQPAALAIGLAGGIQIAIGSGLDLYGSVYCH
jgi:hypothetical protein